MADPDPTVWRLSVLRFFWGVLGRFFVALGLEVRNYTSSHSTSPSFVVFFFFFSR
jgi:hypothetical protein